MQDCNQCKDDPKLRKAWGCDGPTATDECAAEIACPACNGRPVTCSHCDTSGVVRFRRCPWQLIGFEHSELVMFAVRSEQGLLPAPGGFYDQAATFCDAFDFARNELAEWRELLNERAQREAEARAKAKR